MINYYNNQKKKSGQFSYFTHLQRAKISKYDVHTSYLLYKTHP